MFETSFNINYFIILSDDEAFSPMTGFGLNIIQQNSAFNIIAYLPQNIIELELKYPQRISNRINSFSEYSIAPVMIRSFEELQYSPFLYNVCLYDNEFFYKVKETTDKWKIKPFLLEINNKLDYQIIIQNIKEFFNQSLYSNEILKEIKRQRTKNDVIDFIKCENWIIEDEYETHGTTTCVYPYFEQLKFNFKNTKLISDINNNNAYYDNIIKWNLLFQKHIKGFKKAAPAYIGKPDFVITSFPMYNDCH